MFATKQTLEKTKIYLINAALLIFKSKKTGDHHEDMNATLFENWSRNVFSKVPENSVIVKKNAPYRSR